MKILNSKSLIVASLVIGVSAFCISFGTTNQSVKNFSASNILVDDTTVKDTVSIAFVNAVDDTITKDTVVSFKLALMLGDTIVTDTVTPKIMYKSFAFVGDTTEKDTVAKMQYFASL